MNRSIVLRVAAGMAPLSGAAAHAALHTVSAAVAEPPPSGAAGLLQAGFGLAIVLALIFLCAWTVRRFGLQRTGGGRLLKVVASTMVGQRERVVVVEVGSSWLVLGVAAGQVRALHTLPAQALPDPVAGPPLGVGPGLAAATAFSRKLRESLAHLKDRA
jgi:flagellar protein FliO/FliZ